MCIRDRIISVPIEIGPSLALKQSVRFLRSPFDREESYKLSELKTMFLANRETEISRKFNTVRLSDVSYARSGHKGFNWLCFEQYLEQNFTIVQKTFSPFPLTGKYFNSQVWFVCEKKPI